MSRTDAILARLLTLHPKLIDLGLDRQRRLLDAMGNPERRMPPVIHVAGTNGKGSTIAFLRAMLEAAGLAVHVYTSPHLVRFNERIRLAGELVSTRRLNATLEAVEAINAGAPATFFEMTTAAAFQLFAETPADVLLLEVGMGGEFDSTNVVEKPLGTIITPVALDHQQFLGNTVGEIAVAKAGILKRGSLAVIARQEDAARDVIARRAARLGVVPVYAGEDFEGHEEAGRLVFSDEKGLLDLPPPALFGPHQFDNASLAIAALRHFGLPVSDAAIAEGLKRAQWPARMAKLSEGRLAARLTPAQELWLDGGHNAHGAAALRQALDRLDAQRKAPLVLIVGMMNTRRPEDFLAPFADTAVAVHALAIPGETNAHPAARIAGVGQALGLRATAERSIGRALAKAGAVEGARIVICGSLYLAGHVLDANGTPPR
ncbi:bifunctional folylpolyglutamate synthase/dihydrofolate synthase [Devosia enhydra]|nr:folylpolyglutamate synthase/dihydrofolate synthase family protein [Devosia enhydra]